MPGTVEGSGRPIERMLDAVEWIPLPTPEQHDLGLYATHEGTLEVGPLTLKCYVLNDGQRVFDADEVADLFRESPDV